MGLFFFSEVWSKALNKYLTWLQVEMSVQLFLGGFFIHKVKIEIVMALLDIQPQVLKITAESKQLHHSVLFGQQTTSPTTVSSHCLHLVQGVRVCGAYVCACLCIS